MATRSTPNRPPERPRRPASTSPRAAAGSRRPAGASGGARANAATRRGRKVRGRRRRFWFLPPWKVVVGGALGLLALGLIGFYVAYRLIDIPQPNEFADDQTTIVYFSGGTNEMGRFAAQDRTVVESEQIPQHVKDAIVAAEDRSFYENRGVSPGGIARAFWGNLRGESTQGGSTITQQYVKNYYLDFDQTYSRKAKEAIIALKIDQQQTKDETLTAYLNTIYFGRGAYGIQAAAQQYFGKDAADLTVEEGALLAGIIPNPSGWDPAKDPAKATERFGYVLDAMVGLQTLSEGQRDAMVIPTAIVQDQAETYAGPNGYLLAMVRSELLANSSITEQDLDTGGLRITTTISRSAQAAAIEAMGDTEAFPTEDRPETLQAALTSIDPSTGGIVALYGGPDYLARQSNAATQAIAQAGSTFKAFTLVAALEDDISLKSRWDGRNRRTFDAYTDGSGKERPVQNFGGSSFGRISLETATENSVNTVYVDVNDTVGPEQTREVAVRAGLPEDTPGLNDFLSNVLGTASPNPLDMAAAYSTFAAQGVRHTPHIVASVTRAGSDEIVHAGPTEGSQVFDEDVMADTTAALEGVVRSGSGEYASRLGRPAAGKTGTSSDNQSAWFVGYTPQMATSVALFNVEADGSPSTIPGFGGRSEITGGSFPVRIWTTYMAAALEGTEELDFPDRADVGRQPSSTNTESSRPPAPARTSSAPPTTTEPPATSEPPPSPTETATETEPAPTETEPLPTVTLPLPSEPPPTDGTGGGNAAPPGQGAGGGRGGGGGGPGG